MLLNGLLTVLGTIYIVDVVSSVPANNGELIKFSFLLSSLLLSSLEDSFLFFSNPIFLEDFI